MQAESQIASRMSIAGEREFDPLEFDRFTRLQELTRMLAESVDDVASFQESLARTVDSANELAVLLRAGAVTLPPNAAGIVKRRLRSRPAGTPPRGAALRSAGRAATHRGS